MKKVPGHIEEIPEADRPTVDMIAMAAIDWKRISGTKVYTKETHLFHLETAIKAFTAYRDFKRRAEGDDNLTVTIHTSAWGCGAFGNRTKPMTVIQLLAANLVPGVNIVMEGCQEDGSGYQPNFTEDSVTDAAKLILSDKFKTAEDVIDHLLEKQKTDPSWAPKNHIKQT